MRALLPLIVAASLVAGCGYKGALYLPKPKPVAEKPVVPPVTSPRESKEQDKEKE